MELQTVVSELLKGKRAETNLCEYSNGLKNMYKEVAYLRLALNYYTFSEIYYELPKDRKSLCNDEVLTLQELVFGLIIEENINYDEAIKKVSDIRTQIISKMDGITAYADKLGIYEHILNRIEFRFNECEYDDNYYVNIFENDIYNYVVGDKDNSAINMRLSMVMGELPMRLSRNKFYDILRDSFSIYKGSEKMAVKDFVYRIKTAGGIYSTNTSDKKFSKLKKAIDELSSYDYVNATEKEYELYRSKLDKTAALAMDYSDVYMTLAEIINDIYSIALCRNDYVWKEKESLKGIIAYCYDVIENKEEPDVMQAEKFVEFEGLQESLRYKLDAPENALFEIFKINKGEIDKLQLTEDFFELDMISKLQSSSTFVAFEENAEDKEEADDKYIDNVVDGLIEDFGKEFEASNRTYMRAVMSGVISNLPAYFNNLQEFREYVSVSLSQCSDKAEQKACMTVINMLMASE